MTSLITVPTYHKLANSIVIRYDGKTYTLNKTDHRYQKIVEAIEQKQYDNFDSLLDPTKVLNQEGFEVKNGVIYFKNHSIPTILGDQFLDYKIDKVSFMGIVNFWLNLKNRADFEESQEYIVTLLQQKGYPVTEDGFIIAYSQEQNEREVRFDTRKKIITPFFNYSKVAPLFKAMFDKKMTVNQMCEEVFGFCSKKLLKLVTDQMFPQGSFYVNDNILKVGIAFKEVLSPNNIFTVIEKGMYPSNYGHFHAHKAINKFWKDLAINKEGTITESKILNLLSTKYNGDELMEIGSFYETLLASKIPMDLQAPNFNANVSQIHAYLKKEVAKIKNPEFNIQMEAHFPNVEKIVNEKKQVNGLFPVMPKTNYDLIEWSRLLSNCLDSYSQSVLEGQCAIVGFQDEKGKLIYALEITQGKVTQFRSKGNNSPDEKDYTQILDLLFEAQITHTVECFDDSRCRHLKNKFIGY